MNCNAGENNPNYKGEKAWKLKQWKLTVYKSDNYTCQKCGKENLKGHDLHAHHKKDKNKFPELIFDEDNGETLCVSCHISGHQKGIKRSEEAIEKNRRADKSKSHTPQANLKRSETLKKQFLNGRVNAFAGKHHSPETKNKWNRKGANNPMYGVHRYGEDAPNYGKRGVNSPNYGKRHSEETKLRMSEGAKKGWEKRRQNV